MAITSGIFSSDAAFEERLMGSLEQLREKVQHLKGIVLEIVLTSGSFDQLPDEAGAELWKLKRELKARLAPAAEAMVERSGAMRYNGASVAHLHVHFVALDPEPEKTVRFRVSREAAWR